MRKIIWGFLGLALVTLATSTTRAATFALPDENNKMQTSPSIMIEKEVANTLFSAGNNITVKAEVKGDAILAGSILNFDAPVSRNIIAAGQNITIEKDTGASVWAAAENIALRGKVNGNLFAAAASVKIDKDIAGDVFVGAGTLEIAENVTIGGDLYVGARAIIKPDSVVVKGVTNIKLESVSERQSFSQLAWAALVGLLVLLALGAVTLYTLPKTSLKIADHIVKKPFVNLLWSLVGLIITPFIILLLFFSVIGWPLGLILAAFYILSIALTPIFVGLAIGQDILKLKSKPIISMSSGVVILVLIKFIPVIGDIAALAILLAGLGAIIVTVKEQYIQLKDKI